MIKMSWIRSSRGTTLIVLFALALAAVGTAGAISVDDQSAYNESRVGETVSTTIVIDDPFQGDEVSETWTLNASTELENVRWTVTILDQGNQVDETVYGEQRFQQELQLDNGGDEIRIELTGETPPVENYTYRPVERYVLWDLNAVSGSNEADLNDSEIHHYTNDSKEARLAIDNASRRINETGGPPEARNTLNNSVSAYENGNFPNAVDLAEEAQEQAQSTQESQQQTQLLLYVGLAVVALLVVGGGIYYWQSQQDDYGKLQ
jgi:flagellar basal body-associated protein FliL